MKIRRAVVGVLGREPAREVAVPAVAHQHPAEIEDRRVDLAMTVVSVTVSMPAALHSWRHPQHAARRRHLPAPVGSIPRMGILDRILRAGEGKKLKALEGLVPDINARRAAIECAVRRRAARPRPPSSASASNVASRSTTCSSRRSPSCARRPIRVIGQRHFDVQLMGGAALHFGWVAEMKTGEGKTLVSTLPAYLNGLGGKGVHLVTVNDYLARFHAEWMGRIHKWLGPRSRPGHPRLQGAPGREAAGVRRRHHLRHEQRVRLRLPARQHGADARRQGPARPQLRDRRRGRLDPHRRGPHAAHHQRPSRRRRQALLPLRLDRPLAASATSTTRSKRTSASSSRWRPASTRSSRRSASTTSTTRCSRTSSTSCRSR